jgi:hypothetical protein
MAGHGQIQAAPAECQRCIERMIRPDQREMITQRTLQKCDRF